MICSSITANQHDRVNVAALYDETYPVQLPYRKKNDTLVFQPPNPPKKGREGAVASKRFDKGDG